MTLSLSLCVVEYLDLSSSKYSKKIIISSENVPTLGTIVRPVYEYCIMYLSSIDEIVKHYKKEPIHENILLGSPIPKVSRSHLLLITDIYFTLCVEIRSIAI